MRNPDWRELFFKVNELRRFTLLLKIVDRSTPDMESTRVEIFFDSDEESKSFFAEGAPTGFPDVLSKDLTWYFEKRLAMGASCDDDRMVMDRLISHGKYMGDRLAGDDLEILACHELIETGGYSNLNVSIESENIRFFEAPWEALVLPESKYILSSVAKGFCRRFSSIDSEGQVSAPVALELERSKDSPISYCHALYRRGDREDVVRTSNVYSFVNDQIRHDGAVACELLLFSNGVELLDRLSKSRNDFDVFRYEGPLEFRSGALFLPCSKKCDEAEQDLTGTRLTDLAVFLNERNCGLLVLNVTRWDGECGDSLRGATGLAMAAKVCRDSFMPNVLGFDSYPESWLVNHFLNSFLGCLLNGLSVAQAVVEARKALQADSGKSPLCYKPIPFQSWPLPVHYEYRPVRYFSSAVQSAEDITQTQRYAMIRKRMHGFLSEFLPPLEGMSGDSVLLDCLAHLNSKQSAILHIIGESGMGKTQSLHMLGFHLVQNECQHAFYFDFKDGFYSANRMREMVAPIVIHENADSVGGIISESNLYLLDNVELSEASVGKATVSEWRELERYLEGLLAQGHRVVVSGSSKIHLFSTREVGKSCEVRLGPMDVYSQWHLASKLLESRGGEAVEDDSSIERLVALCRGNPFLIKNVMSLVETTTIVDLVGEAEKELCDLRENAGDRFFTWQWQHLNPFWQRWLMLAADLRGVILEMIAVAMDSSKSFEAANELYELIGYPGCSFSEGIDTVSRRGFTVKYPVGRVINSRCAEFLNGQAEDDNLMVDRRGELESLMARIVCRALVKVIPEVMKNADQMILQNLVVNRGQWAKHLERVWRDGHCEEFSVALRVLSDLLKQAGLAAELSQWALHMISSAQDDHRDAQSPSDKFLDTWVRLASMALDASDALENEKISLTVRYSVDWLRGQGNEEIPNPALFTRVVQFLQAFFTRTGDWESVLEIGEIGLHQYIRNQVWPLVISTLHMLAESAARSGANEQALGFEQRLLEEVPMDDFNDALKLQCKARIVAGRLERRSIDLAQVLLNEMHQDAEGDRQAYLVDVLQADLYYRDACDEKALLLYEKLVSSSDAEGNSANNDFLRQRYDELKARLEKNRT